MVRTPSVQRVLVCFAGTLVVAADEIVKRLGGAHGGVGLGVLQHEIAANVDLRTLQATGQGHVRVGC